VSASMLNCNSTGGERGMKFRPLHDRVVVQRLESEEKTAGGIIIPDTAKEKPMEGKVIAVGAGARDEQGKVQPLDVKAGDSILFGKWSGTEVKIDGQDYLIMKESDIMGIID
jgi:chaperonin GroES